MSTITSTRLSPVKSSARKPFYCISNGPSLQAPNNHISGFGFRHLHDDAPFSLWDNKNETFRDPSREELSWIRQRYDAKSIELAFPHMCIRTVNPPHPVPWTVAAALVRFAPPESTLALTPMFDSRPYGNRDRDVLDTKLLPFSFPEPEVCISIIRNLTAEVKIRAIHFLPPLIIVEVKNGSEYERYSLPGCAGGMNIIYHVSPTPYWANTTQLSYSRLLEPTDLVLDNSDYLYADPKILSPGVCLASMTLDHSGLLTTSWKTTSAGVMLQRGSERSITVANHGFGYSDEVYHPTPLGRRIGRIIQRFPELDIGLLSLDPSISFSNARYFQAPAPQRMVPHHQIRAGDYFECDGISTGRFDLVACGKSFYYEDPIPPSVEYDCIDVRDWKIEMTYSTYGATGGRAKDGVCGAPLVDRTGRVGGFFRYADINYLFAHTPALDDLIRRGWSIV